MPSFKDINNITYTSHDVANKLINSPLTGVHQQDLLLTYRQNTSQTGSVLMSNILDRLNHIGTQPISSIINLQTTLDGKVINPYTQEGSLIVSNSSSQPAELQIGTVGKFLKSDGTNPLWGNLPIADETTQGIIQVATEAERIAGINDTKAITPLKLQNNNNVIQRALDVGKPFNVIQPAVTLSPTVAIPVITAPKNDGGSFVAGLNILQYLSPANEVQNKSSAITFKNVSDVNLGTWLKTESPVTNNRILFPSNLYTLDVQPANEPVNYTVAVTLKVSTPNVNRQKFTVRLRRAVANPSGLFLFGTSIVSAFNQQTETDGTLVINAIFPTFVRGEDDPFVTGGVIVDLSLKEGTSQLAEVTTVRIYCK